MIELKENEDGLIVVRLAGAIDQSEYQAVMPRAQGIIASAVEPLCVLLEIAEDAAIEPTVMWDDMRFGETNAHLIKRIAIVGPPQWEGYAELVRDTDIDARLFPPREAAAARSWAVSGS